jgi:hypothetical protein
MDVTPAGMVMAVSTLAFWNAPVSMDVSWLLAAKVTFASLLAPLNVFAAMDVTPAGMVMAVSALAFWNAPIPMEVSWLPAAKVTVVSALAPKNA